MSSKDLTLRIGHSEGLTDLCYDVSGKYLISCGFDGSVKIWKGVGDDEPRTLRLGDEVHSVAIKGATLYVGTDNHSVDRYEFPKGEPDGILARFTGTPTCLAVSESKKFVAAGSSDFDLKVMVIETGKQKCFLGHQAPVLSVALDPMDEYLSSVSCDGTMKIWNLSNQECVQSLSVIKPSNDVGNSESMGKICWRPATGEDIAVPVADGVGVYSRLTWQLSQSFKTDITAKKFQCCAFSLCGRFVAAGTADGWIVVWDAETQECVRTQQSPHKASICTVAWNPQQNNSLAFSDIHGQVGVLENVVLSEEETKKDNRQNDIDALFDDDDDNMMVDLMAEEENRKEEEISTQKKRKQILEDSDNESDLPSMKPSQNDLPPIPSTLDVFGDDNLDLAPPTIPPPAGASKPILDDDASSVATGQTGAVASKVQASSMQLPFQPGSTPTHLSHRFMVWNSVGVIRCYNDEVENAIDIEFHDAQTHHPLHLSNNEQFTMGDLSRSAAVFASESDGDQPSKLKCVHFSSWDNNKQWSIDMPDGEEIQCITIGDCWIAACTDSLQVRLFALGGTQRQIFSLPGPAVAMAAHTDQLLIAYHITQGFGNNQCLGFMLLEVGAGSGCKARRVVGGQPLPISTASTLVWLGFTSEGTPATVDSSGVVRLMNRAFCSTWTNVLNTKRETKSRYDHYWVVGLHQDPQQVRCILCKGLNYPVTLPRPTLTVLPYKMPYCDMESDKGAFEEEYWRTRLMYSYTDYLTSRGYEEDAETKQKSQLNAQRTLMKLFALLCKGDQEFQAHEICSLMPTAASVNLAIKYASRIRKIMLAQRLSEVAQDKAQDEMEAAIRERSKRANGDEEGSDEEDEEEVEDFRTELQSGYSTSETEWSKRKSQATPSVTSSQASRVTDRDSDVQLSQRPPAEAEPESKAKSGRSLSSQLAGTRRNPFKKTTAQSPAASAPVATSSGGVLDNIKRTTPTQPRRAPLGSDSASRKPKGKDSAKKQKSAQSTLFSTKLNLTSTPKPKKQGQRCKLEDDDEAVEVPVLKEKLNDGNGPRKTSGVQLYIEENIPRIQEEHPEMDGVDVRKIAIQDFRSLAPEDRTVWNDRAKASQQQQAAPSPASAPSGQKRKHVSEEVDDENPDENEPPVVESQSETHPKSKKMKDCDSGAKSGLAAFAYQLQE